MSDPVLETAAQNISTLYGTLDDFPEEYANTLANVYYEQASRIRDGRHEGWLPPEVLRDGLTNGLADFISKSADLVGHLQTLPDRVAALRSLRNEGKRDLYDYLIQLELDMLKYGIENAHKKPGIVRAIQRKLKKPRPEIPALWRIMRGFIE